MSMTAGELRKLLEGVPDESPVIVYDSEYGGGAAEVEIEVVRIAQIERTWSATMLQHRIWDAAEVGNTNWITPRTEWRRVPEEVEVAEEVWPNGVAPREYPYSEEAFIGSRTMTARLLSVSEPVTRVTLTSA